MSQARRNATVLRNSTTFPLHVAILRGEIQKIRELLLKKDVDVNKCSRTIGPPLCFAAENGKADAVRVLLRSGKIDINSSNRRKPSSYYGLTALELATRKSRGNGDVVQELLEHGIRLILAGNNTLKHFILVVKHSGRTAIFLDLIVKTVLEYENGNNAWEAKLNLLKLCLRNPLPQYVRPLLDAGVRPDSECLELAVNCHNQPVVIQNLVQYGKSITNNDINDMLMMCLCKDWSYAANTCRRSCFAVRRSYFYKFCLFPNCTNAYVDTTMIGYLCEAGANMYQTVKSGYNILWRCIAFTCQCEEYLGFDIFSIFLFHGLNPKAYVLVNGKQDSALRFALEYKYPNNDCFFHTRASWAIAILLVYYGADVDDQNQRMSIRRTLEKTWMSYLNHSPKSVCRCGHYTKFCLLIKMFIQTGFIDSRFLFCKKLSTIQVWHADYSLIDERRQGVADIEREFLESSSLKYYCRIAIRKQLLKCKISRNSQLTLPESIKQLPIPEILKEYLNLNWDCQNFMHLMRQDFTRPSYNSYKNYLNL